VTGSTHISIGDQHTHVHTDDEAAPAVDLNLGIGVQQLGRGPFRHEPPSEMELESAIAFVEDAVMPLAKVLPSKTRLASSDAIASRLLASARSDPHQPAGLLTLAQVEHVFNQLVAVSLGRPASSSGVPTDASFVAYVLVLREFMHHLAFAEISIASAFEGAAK
jgi:exopolyphosphatase/pppGpp-phosphohydrolase